MEPEIRSIVGLRELVKKLDGRLGVPEAGRRFLSRWALSVQGDTVRNMKRGKGGWVWKSHTRRSITHAIDGESGKIPAGARVGSNQETARWGEFGTGLLSEDPKSTKRRHWPPSAPLEAWAAAHGIEPVLSKRDGHVIETPGEIVAAAIGLRGGIKPRRFLRTAARDNARKIPGWVNTFAHDIERLAPGSDPS